MPACAARTGWSTSAATTCGRPSCLRGEQGRLAAGIAAPAPSVSVLPTSIWLPCPGMPSCSGMAAAHCQVSQPCCVLKIPAGCLPLHCAIPSTGSLPADAASQPPAPPPCSKGEWSEVEIPLSRFLLTWKGKVVEEVVEVSQGGACHEVMRLACCQMVHACCSCTHGTARAPCQRCEAGRAQALQPPCTNAACSAVEPVRSARLAGICCD